MSRGLFVGTRGAQRRAMLLAAGLLIAAGVWFVMLSPGRASAADGACGYGSSGGNTRTCLSVSNGSVSTSATVISSGRTIQSCLHRNGARVECTNYQYVSPGAGIGLTWVPGGDVPDGNYCAVTWRLNTDGTTTEIDGGECVGVGTTVIGG